MEPLTQKILSSTLVTVIKGVAIAGLIADVIIFYGNRHGASVIMVIKKKVTSIKRMSLFQLTKTS